MSNNLGLDVVWADNTEQLRRNLALGLQQVNATKDSVDRLANSLAGESQIRAADRWQQALQKLGGEAGALAGIQSLTSAEIDRGTAVIDKAIAKYTALGATAPKALTDISDALHQTTTATSGWGDIFASVGQSFVAQITAANLLTDAIRGVVGGVTSLAAALPQIALKGAAVDDVASNFERLTSQAGRLGSTLLGSLRDGTHDTVSNFELMKTANQDLAAGMNLTDQQFGVLSKGAFALAQATGTDVKQALDTMNDAMLTGRTRALSLLTGKIDLTAAEEKFAAGLGSTVEHLSAEGKIEAARVAILDSVGKATQRLGEQTDGLDERVAQANVSWENFSNNLGKAIATSSVLEAGMSGIKDALIQTFGSQQETLIKAIADRVDDAAIALVSLGKIGVTAGGALATEWYALQKVFGDIAQIVQGDALAFEYLALGVAKVGAATSLGQSAQQRYAEDVKRIDSNITSLLVSMKARGDALQADSAAQGGVSATTAKYVGILDDLQAKMVAAQKGATEFVGPLEAGAKAQASIGDAANKSSQYLQASKRDLADAARAAEEARKAWDEYNAVGLSVVDTINKLDGRVVEAIKFDLQRGESVETLTKIYGVHKESIQAIEQEQKFLASVTDTTTKSFQGLYLVVPDLTNRTQEFTYALQGLTKDGLLPVADGFDDLARAQKAEDLFTQQQQKSLDALQTQLAHTLGLMPDLSVVAHQTMQAATSSTNDWGTAIEAVGRSLSRVAGVDLGPILKQIAQIKNGSVTQTNTGVTGSDFVGGGIAGGLGGANAVAGGDSAASSIGKVGVTAATVTAAAAVQAGALTAGTIALGAATFGIGAAAVGVAVLLKHLLTVSEEEKEARKNLEDFIKPFGSLESAIESAGQAYALLGKSGTEAQSDLQAALDASHVSAEAEAAALGKVNSVLAQSKQRAKDVTEAIGAVGPAFGSIVKGAALTKDSINDLGTQAVTVFAAQVAGGLSVADALKADGPALQSLSDSYKALGLDVGNVALQNLLMQNTITQGNPDLLNAIGGLASEMEALNKLGVLNADTFQAMERTGTATYAQLQASVAAVGGSTKDALIPMQAYLHDAANEADQLGIPLDDNNQLLIDQSKELGIWKEAGKDATAALNDSTAELNKTMQSLVETLTGSGGLTDAFKGIPSVVNVTIVRHYVDAPSDSPPPSDGASTGGFVMPTGIHHFAYGGFVPQGTDTVPAMLTPGEIILNAAQQRNIGSLLSSADVASLQQGGRRDDAEVKALREEFKSLNRYFRRDMHQTLARAVRDEVQKVTKVRL